jgi:hypothetical protein
MELRLMVNIFLVLNSTVHTLVGNHIPGLTKNLVIIWIFF